MLVNVPRIPTKIGRVGPNDVQCLPSLAKPCPRSANDDQTFGQGLNNTLVSRVAKCWSDSAGLGQRSANLDQDWPSRAKCCSNSAKLGRCGPIVIELCAEHLAKVGPDSTHVGRMLPRFDQDWSRFANRWSDLPNLGQCSTNLGRNWPICLAVRRGASSTQALCWATGSWKRAPRTSAKRTMFIVTQTESRDLRSSVLPEGLWKHAPASGHQGSAQGTWAQELSFSYCP